MINLSERVALVTGGGTGIGRAIAEAFAQQGARVVVNYSRSRDAAEQVAAGIRSRGGAAMAVAADVSKQLEVSNLIFVTEREFGRLDYLINNAGWTKRVPHANIDELTDDVWDRALNVNLRGAFNAVRAAAPLLKRQPGAAIVNIASVGALSGQGSSMAYAAAKGGMVTMTKSLARALAPEVRVNAVLPGFVRTHFGGAQDSIYEHAERITPLRRLATTADVAAATLFFATTAVGITGETLVVDGGMQALGPAI
jgi:3-oxoacyl-[acyl-carrier protein] reductase